jgi:large subunit ribosomal protein L30
VSTVTVVQRKSRNGCDQRQLDTLRSLGLRRIGQSVEVNDTPQIRGMIAKVAHLVEVQDSSRMTHAADVQASPDGERRRSA